MRLILIFLSLILASASLFAAPNPQDYPHWNFKNPQTYQKLTKIDNFIKAHKGENVIAGFDWDGTLYSEEIQPIQGLHKNLKWPGDQVFTIWAGQHINDPNYPKMFPLFHTDDHQSSQDIIQKALYFMGRQSVKVKGYNLFSQLAILPAGMTPKEFAHAERGYLKDYPVSDYAFLPMLDLMQHMINEGFHVWIITGGNPYFTSVVLDTIEKELYYTPGVHYQFNLSSVPYDPSTSHIVGNMAKLLKNGRFSMVYDNRFEKNPHHLMTIVDGRGKYIALRYYIEQRENAQTIFYAGNSGGDYWVMRYVVKRGGLGVSVNPYGILTKLDKQFPHNIIVMPMRSKIFPAADSQER